MHNFDNMQWMETFYAHSTKLTRKKKTNPEIFSSIRQILLKILQMLLKAPKRALQ